MSIPELAEALNTAAADFEIGRLQELRVRLRSLGRRPSASLFDRRTIFPTYAFHVGGRSELQFNVGEELRDGATVIRWGVAFSLEPSQSLPSIDVLFPKIDRYKEYVREQPEEFLGFRMWHFERHVFKRERPVGPVDDEVRINGNFIAIGQWRASTDVDVAEILSDFDRLLPLYRYVESDAPLAATKATEFRAGCPTFVFKTVAFLGERTVDVALRHRENTARPLRPTVLRGWRRARQS